MAADSVWYYNTTQLPPAPPACYYLLPLVVRALISALTTSGRVRLLLCIGSGKEVDIAVTSNPAYEAVHLER